MGLVLPQPWCGWPVSSPCPNLGSYSLLRGAVHLSSFGLPRLSSCVHGSSSFITDIMSSEKPLRSHPVGTLPSTFHTQTLPNGFLLETSTLAHPWRLTHSELTPTPTQTYRCIHVWTPPRHTHLTHTNTQMYTHTYTDMHTRRDTHAHKQAEICLHKTPGGFPWRNRLSRL